MERAAVIVGASGGICGGRAEICAPMMAELTRLAANRRLMPMSEPIDVIIYHNPSCGTSRNTLGLIRNAGVEPHVIE